MSVIQKLVVEGHGTVRQLDGKFSIYDVITVCGKKGSDMVWRRLVAAFPEVSTYCWNFKFPGTGQRFTPVTDKQGIFQIIGLLPGQVGKEYRREAARVLLMKLEAPADLARELVETARTVEEADEIIAQVLEGREQYMQSYHGCIPVIAEAGGRDAVITVNYHNTKAIRGKTPKQIREETGARTGRKDMSYEESIKLACVQLFQTKKLERTKSKGSEAVNDCLSVLNRFIELEAA